MYNLADKLQERRHAELENCHWAVSTVAFFWQWWICIRIAAGRTARMERRQQGCRQERLENIQLRWQQVELKNNMVVSRLCTVKHLYIFSLGICNCKMYGFYMITKFRITGNANVAKATSGQVWCWEGGRQRGSSRSGHAATVSRDISCPSSIYTLHML
jgi:hypothetical protein